MKVYELTKAIQERKVAPKEISQLDRRAVVEYLVYEGHSTEELAMFLDVCDRTIERDRAANRKRYLFIAKIKDPDYFVSMVIREADVCKAKLRKLARQEGTGVDDLRKIQKAIHDINMELTDRLAKIGKLPSSAMKVEIDSEVKHSGSISLTRGELEQRIEDNRRILERSGWLPSSD